MNGVPVIEQPGSSILTMHKSFQQVNALLRAKGIYAAYLNDCDTGMYPGMPVTSSKLFHN